MSPWLPEGPEFWIGVGVQKWVAGLPCAAIRVVTVWRSILECWPPPAFRLWPTHLSGEWGGVGFPLPWEETGDGTRPVVNSRPIWYPADRGQVGVNLIPPCVRVFGPSEPWASPAGGREFKKGTPGRFRCDPRRPRGTPGRSTRGV